MTPLRADAVRHFDDLYAGADDPWGYRDDPYERGKYAATLDALPAARYGRVWEPGCSIGELTRLLTERADEVIAEDASAQALRVAGAGGTPPGVTWTRRELPDAPPGVDGTVGLVVLSEVLYYLDADARAATAAAARRLLVPGGDLVAVHYRLPADDYDVSGDEAARELRARPGWTWLGSRVEEKFRIDVGRVS